MQKILEKLAWKTRRWNFKFQSFTLYLNNQSTWGFNLMTFSTNLRDYSLLSFEFRLPNKTHVKTLSIDHWDLFYVRNYLSDRWDDLDDRELWSGNLGAWEKIQLSVLDKLFRL